MLSQLPIDSIDAAEPILPIESTEPTLPIDSTEPREPIESTESCDHSDHFDVFIRPSVSEKPEQILAGQHAGRLALDQYEGGVRGLECVHRG
jgi:hypothetical protein